MYLSGVKGAGGGEDDNNTADETEGNTADGPKTNQKGQILEPWNNRQHAKSSQPWCNCQQHYSSAREAVVGGSVACEESPCNERPRVIDKKSPLQYNMIY
jgi:hypothetical protein